MKNRVSKNLKKAELAIELVAMRQGIPVEKVRAQIQLAMLNGMSSDDPMVNAMWKSVPRAGDIPTPEELVAFCIDEVLKDKQ